MTPLWPRRRSKARASASRAEREHSPSGAERSEPERGPKVRLECLTGDDKTTVILATLRERYEVSALDEGSRQFQVVVDDAVFPDEAVVRLASALDEIDRDWAQHIRWPKVQP